MAQEREFDGAPDETREWLDSLSTYSRTMA